MCWRDFTIRQCCYGDNSREVRGKDFASSCQSVELLSFCENQLKDFEEGGSEGFSRQGFGSNYEPFRKLLSHATPLISSSPHTVESSAYLSILMRKWKRR